MTKMHIRNKGFSLVELIIVIAIMAILTGVLAPVLIGNIEKTRESTDLQNLDAIRSAIVTTMSDEDVYEEIMQAVATTSPLIIDLGEGKTASLSSISYTKFKEKLEDGINSSVDMKSSVAANNHLYIEITKDGEIAVYVDVSGSSGSSGAMPCAKTFEADGSTPKKFISK